MTGDVRLLRRSVSPLAQGEPSADKGDLGPIVADSPWCRDAPVTHTVRMERGLRGHWAECSCGWRSHVSPHLDNVDDAGWAHAKLNGADAAFDRLISTADRVTKAALAERTDLTAPERRWESAWDDRGNWR